MNLLFALLLVSIVSHLLLGTVVAAEEVPAATTKSGCTTTTTGELGILAEEKEVLRPRRDERGVMLQCCCGCLRSHWLSTICCCKCTLLQHCCCY
jgi:hypothetical protein